MNNNDLDTEKDEELMKCPVCENYFKRNEMLFSFDCHGIPFRLICKACNTRIIVETGYDGEYYTELDEQIEPD